MFKQRTIACFLLCFIISMQALAQDGVDLRSIKKEIGKTDKMLATEFAAIKLIPAEILMRQYECHDSSGFYSSEKNSADSFYISQYEVTNMQYRQFLEYIQDSIVRKLMGYVKQDADGNEYNDLTKKFDITQYYKRMEKIDICPITPMDYFSFTPLFITSNGVTHMRLRSFIYSYKVEKKRIEVPVIPDTAYWKLGAARYLKKPVVMDDFWLPSINNFPVTGINVNQAKAFCHWKTKQLKNALGNNSTFDIIFSLPTKSQWEAAAVSGLLPDKSSQCLLENENQSYTNTKNGITELNGLRYIISFKRKAE